MHTTRVSIESPDLPYLFRAIKYELKDWDAYSLADGIYLFMKEEYYYRINSELMTVATLDMTAPNKCEMRIITGGGAHGMFGVTWGSEQNQNQKIIRALEIICEVKSWKMSVEDVPHKAKSAE